MSKLGFKRRTGESESDNESTTSAKRRNEEKFEHAERLKAKIKANPNLAIESEVFYGKHLTSYKSKQGLEEK